MWWQFVLHFIKILPINHICIGRRKFMIGNGIVKSALLLVMRFSSNNRILMFWTSGVKNMDTVCFNFLLNNYNTTWVIYLIIPIIYPELWPKIEPYQIVRNFSLHFWSNLDQKLNGFSKIFKRSPFAVFSNLSIFG